MCTLLNNHSILKTDDSIFKEPIAPQEAFRTSLSYKMSHTYMHA